MSACLSGVPTLLADKPLQNFWLFSCWFSLLADTVGHQNDDQHCLLSADNDSNCGMALTDITAAIQCIELRVQPVSRVTV